MLMTDQDRMALLSDFDEAPGIIEGADVELSPHEAGIDAWIRNVPQGTLKGLVRGRRPDAGVPDFLREPGPLRDSLISEFAFRSLSEEAATKACGMIVASADTLEGLEFYATQTLDEARHAQIFRDHLVDLGVPADELHETVARVAGADRDRVIGPLWDWGLPAFAETFVNGVVIVTVLLEGVLAPTTELSERKWKPISPATTDIERGACVDEIRHLAVGSWFVRRHLLDHPEDRERVRELIADGRRVWESLPVPEIIYKREQLYQEGIQQHRAQIGDYEVFPGRRLVDTTAEERLMTAVQWSQQVQEQRLTYMGLGDAVAASP